MGALASSVGKESACNAGDWVQSLGKEDPPEEDMATHSSISCLENPIDRGAWQTTAYGVARVAHDLVIKLPPVT